MADGDRKIPAVSWLTYEPFSTDFAKAAMDRFEAEQKRLKSSKRHDRIRRAWERVYSRDKNGACDNTLIQQRGTRGEILELQPNRFARILRDNMSDVRTSPPKFVPEALNSSAKSQDQAALGKGVLKWYERKLKLLDARIERVEIMQLASESVQHIWWDYQKGREAAVGNSAADGVQPIEVGSRVVATVNHMPGMAGRAGTVALVRDGDEQPFYAVLFDGESEPHKWLAADELEAEDSDAESAESSEESAAERPIVYEGDFLVSIRSPYDYSIDPTPPDKRRPRWAVVREPMDRYEAVKRVDEEIAALKGAGKGEAPKRSREQLQQLRDAIMAAEPWSKRMAGDWKYEDDAVEFDDSIAVFHVYGDRTFVCEDGRHAIVLDRKNVIDDGPLVDDRMGVFVQRARDVVFRCEPHSDVYDGLPIAEAHGACVTTMLSNADAHGLLHVAAARKSNVRREAFATGLNQIDYDHMDPSTNSPVPPPIFMNPPPMPEMVLSLEELLTRELDLVLGGSPVKRGDPDATKGDSGSKTAMLYAASQTANSPLITSTLEVDAEVATFLIGSLSKRATTERLISIVGEKNTYIAKSFTGADLKEISQVTVEPANAARDTFEGRMAMVEVLKDADPQQREMIMELVNTGQITSSMEPTEIQRMLIERENADLMDPGKANAPPPVVAPGDNHMEHYVKHQARLADPEIRNDEARYKRTLAHCGLHIQALMPSSQNFAGWEALRMTGQSPLPESPTNPWPQPPAPPGGAPSGPQASPGGPPTSTKPHPSQPGGPPGEGQPHAMAQHGPGAGMPDMPRQPVNPASGERINLPVPSGPVT